MKQINASNFDKLITLPKSPNYRVIDPAMAKLLDIFPDTDIRIGGSTARGCIQHGEGALITGDVDIYTNLSICRYAFKEILQKIVFEDKKVYWTSNEEGDTPGNKDYYKMPHIRRRVSCTVEGIEYDFIFLNPAEVTDIGLFLEKFQASYISECWLRPVRGWGGTIDYQTGYSAGFRSCVKNGERCRLNTHKDVSTEGHANKVKAWCRAHDIQIEEYSQPYSDRSKAEFSVTQRARDLPW